MADYRVLVADLLTGTIREEIPFPEFSYGRILCRAGSFKGRLPFSPPKATLLNLEPKKTALYIERSGVIVWGGIVWTARKSSGSPYLDVGASGFWSYFGRRRIRWNATYAGSDQLNIARNILALAQSATFSPGGDIGVQLDPLLSGVPRDRTYLAYERKKVSTAVEELSAVDGGFEFLLDCNWVSGAIERRLRFGYPRLGSRTGQVFELGGNVTDVGWALDGTGDANRLDAIGAGEGESMLIATAADPAQLTAYPLLEDVTSYKDVAVVSTLNHHALADLVARSGSLGLSNIAVRTTTDVPVGSWTVGDEVVVRAHDGFVDIDGYYRIVADDIKVNAQGTEDVSLSFAGADQF